MGKPANDPGGQEGEVCLSSAPTRGPEPEGKVPGTEAAGKPEQLVAKPHPCLRLLLAGCCGPDIPLLANQPGFTVRQAAESYNTEGDSLPGWAATPSSVLWSRAKAGSGLSVSKQLAEAHWGFFPAAQSYGQQSPGQANRGC